MINNPVLSLAIVFILGFFSAHFIKKIKLPTITAYVVLGLIISPDFLNIISKEFLATSEFFSDIVLGMIAFSLGEAFSFKSIKRVGKAVASISLSASILPWLIVTVVVWLVFHQPLYIALILGAIAAATDPATTVIVSQEYKSKGEFTDTLLGVVAIDDVWALIVFGLSLSLAKSFANGNGDSIYIWKDLLKAGVEIGGSFVLGIGIAWIFNKFAYLINSSKERLIYMLGFLSLVIGLSIMLNFSILLSCMFFGTILVNGNKSSFEFFDSLREVDSPLYLIFFVLAGASLKISVLGGAIFLTVGFIIFRIFGKIIGAYFGAKIIGASSSIKKYMGWALIPQAGVALACALIAKNEIGGEMGDKILTITIASTVFFEILGPWITKLALVKAGDVK
ncbi:MAG: cation:proton antiporter [Candidatus Omnitrophica bacterium]|nr:cation:proton antiporter [Candidatus Omnitrophota bacterium]